MPAAPPTPAAPATPLPAPPVPAIDIVPAVMPGAIMPATGVVMPPLVAAFAPAAPAPAVPGCGTGGATAAHWQTANDPLAASQYCIEGVPSVHVHGTAAPAEHWPGPPRESTSLPHPNTPTTRSAQAA